MDGKEDISARKDIELLVDTFYGKVKVDAMIGPVFHQVIGADWTKHLERMYSFWETVLFTERTYYGNPFSKHAKLPITGIHFNRWIRLFYETVGELFQGEKADETKLRAEKMSQMFQIKLQQAREEGRTTIM